MDDPSIPGFTRCGECGADNPTLAVRCWLCGAALDRSAKRPELEERPVDAEVVTRYPPPPPPPPVAAAAQQSRWILLFVTITVIFLCVGLWNSARGLTILLLIVAVPALVRASAVSSRMAAGGKRLQLVDVLIAFAMSFALVVLVLVAGFVAFFIACVAAIAGFGTQRIEPIVWTAVLSGLAAFVVLNIALWPRRQRD